MKVLAYILSVLFATALLLGATLLIVLVDPSQPPGTIALAAGALTVFVYGPLVLGSLLAFWDVRGSAASRTSFRRWLSVVAGLNVLGWVAIVVFAVLTSAPLWLPILFIGGSAVLFLVSVLVGRALRSHEISHRGAIPAWTPISREQIRHKILIVGITFFGALIVGVVLFGVLGLFDSGHHAISDLLGQVGFILEFACFGGALACIFVSLPLNRMLRDTVSSDLGQVRKISKVVLRGKALDLTQEEVADAARYAATATVTLSFQLSYIALLYIGIGMNQAASLGTSVGTPVAQGILVLLIVVLIVFVPLTVRRIGRARAFARDHRDLLPIPSNAEPV